MAASCRRRVSHDDVCKAWLDVYIHPVGQNLRVANDRGGLKKLKRELTRYDVACVVTDATGKYHRQVHRSLHEGGFTVAVDNPIRSRSFAEAVGLLPRQTHAVGDGSA